MGDMLTGVALGLAAGLVPGPLFVLVIQQTLRHGSREGVKVAAVPMLTDMPIIVLAMVGWNCFGSIEVILGGTSLLGAVFLLYLAYESLTLDASRYWSTSSAPRSVQKSVIANLLNPHPYLFWLTVGAPVVWKAWLAGPIQVTGLFVGFYSCLVGSKMLIAILVGQGKRVLHSRFYRATVKVLGLVLAVFAARLFQISFDYLGFWS